MSSTEAVPAGAALPEVRGLAAGSAVLGMIFLVTVVAFSARPVAALVGALIFAVLFTLFLRPFARGRQLRLWTAADHADGGRSLDAQAAFRRGLMQSLLLTATEAVLLVVLARLWSLQDVTQEAGIVLACAALSGLSARDLRRWQYENQRVVCRRVGARWVVWTRKQAQSGLVTIPAHGPALPEHASH